MYFERQGFLSSLCGKCALNNLLGSEVFTTTILNEICDNLAKEVEQDYRHILGGDYDVNVLISALKLHSKESRWINGSQFQANKERIVDCPNLRGFIINQKLQPNFFKGLVGLSDRHWVAVRQHKNKFYVFDSKASNSVPEALPSLISFLQWQFQRGSYVIQVIDI